LRRNQDDPLLQQIMAITIHLKAATARTNAVMLRRNSTHQQYALPLRGAYLPPSGQCLRVM
jgi:hypothetical protein